MKYNDNGEYKDIYVKTFDTLPIGTEVDYDGSAVPSGWEEVDNILWTNPSPTSEFASQSIAISNLSEFSHYSILFRDAITTNYYLSTNKIPIDLPTRLNIALSINVVRNVIPSSTEITFANAQYYNTYSGNSTTTDNRWLIPYQIIGYKE